MPERRGPLVEHNGKLVTPAERSRLRRAEALEDVKTKPVKDEDVIEYQRQQGKPPKETK
jgi:hypothetical protein